MKIEAVGRIRALSFCIFFFASILTGKLFFIQIVRGAEYSEAADRQYTTPASRIFDRGSIFFRERSGELASAATLGSGFIIAMSPKLLLDAEDAYVKMNAIVPISHDEFILKAGKTEDPYEELARRVGRAEADLVDGLNLPGISIYKEKWRFYPLESVAARIIGFVGYNKESVELGGRYGVERYYEEVLGRHGDNLYVNFFAEVFSNLGDAISGSSNREGDVILTIEPEVERALNTELRSVMEAWSPDMAGGVIMDPKTGKIFGMEVLPSFDPNNLKNVKDTKVLGNPIVESVYEMGSIIKPLTMAAGLDAGVVTPRTTYTDKGFVELNGYKINNFDGKGRGTVPMQEVLNQSLNTGMVFVMQRLGKERLKEYFMNYGMGEETGIDLPGETRGLVKNLDGGREVEFATAAFGQGIALTPIETVRALAALGNGGRLVDPHVTESIDYKGGFSREPAYTLEGRQVISKKSSEEITRMLVEVVDKALLGGTVKMPEYSIAAKTGTAQMARENGRGYYDDRYLHSFFGYFPAYDPKFIVFLYAVNPKGATFASHTLTYPFIRLTKFLLNYYEIPPDRAGGPDQPTIN